MEGGEHLELAVRPKHDLVLAGRKIAGQRRPERDPRFSPGKEDRLDKEDRNKEDRISVVSRRTMRP